MTTRFVTIKTEADIPAALKGLVSFQITDGNVDAVVVKVGEDFIRINKAETYSTTLKVTKQAPKKLVKKFKLYGKFLGITDVLEIFDKQSDAEERHIEFKQSAQWQDTNLVVEEFEDFVDDQSL
jgi:hypothetical protein